MDIRSQRGCHRQVKGLMLGALGTATLWHGLLEQPGFSATPDTPPSALAVDAATVAQLAAERGNAVTINGLNAALPWMRRDGRIGLADYGLTDHIGLRLLNSENPQQQPVQWFTGAGQPPLTLSAWVQGGHRYLDITPLVQQHGWTISNQGQTLQITTPVTRIEAIRQGSQPWGERLVVQVSGPTVAQLVEESGRVTLTVGAVGPSNSAQVN
ncbi:MAG: hypothetical protein HC929_01735, partial [Leptolyngbyaceae cyanobacterium SM2_5_2]|nr:hypothetical protein [Leptolyngbyaceae cyanobacterium SM2_5_2]